jgi:hypothetical protein
MSWLYDSDDSNPDDLFDSDPDDDNTISKPDPHDDMPLPPENFYAIEEEMFGDIQAWSAQYHYAFQKGRSKPIGKDRKKLLYQCDCAGLVPVSNRQQDDPQRLHDRICSTSSKKTGCEFSVSGVQVDQHH